MARWWAAGAIVVLVVAVVVWGIRGGAGTGGAVAPSTPPNVLLVTLDTTRADRLGSYGYSAASTPTLDRLAADGVRFERALSPAPLTLPAHASLLTGRDPYAHGVRNNGHFTLPAEVKTLAAHFSARGYDTAAFVSSFVLDRQFGLAQGFAHYDDRLDPPRGTYVALELERRGDRTVAAAATWLASRPTPPARPFFLWVHLYDAHDPYVPPSPFRERFADRPYDGEIAFTDEVLGTLLQRSGYGTATPPLVIVAGDHGESLGEHGESTHGLFVYDAALRVPLIVAWPGTVTPAVVREPVRLVDVAPTIADLAGVGALDDVEGRSVRGLMSGVGPSGEAPPAYSETLFPEFFMAWAPLRAVEAGRWKYIDAPEPELYDLRADPGERVNKAAEESAAAATLKRTLEGMVGATAGRMASTPLSDDARQRLASLGYISAAAQPERREGSRLPDPKRMVDLFERLLEGNRALARGQPGEAATLASAALARDPGNAFARLLLARASLALAQNERAITSFEAYLKLVPTSADAHHWMALALLRSGDRTRALVEEDAALALDPRHGAALALKAGLLFSTGRAEEGIRLLRAAVERDPSNDGVRLELADLLTDARRYDEAEPEYRKVIGSRPGDMRALTGLGRLLTATGRPQAALELLDRALAIDEGEQEARFERAEALLRLGRAGEARAEYQRLTADGTRPDLRAAAQKRLASGGSGKSQDQ